MENKILVSICRSYNWREIYTIVEQHFEILKIYRKLNNVKKILLKPNLLGPHLPEKAVTTHPEFLRAIIKLSKGYNKEVLVGDSASVLNFEEVITTTGIKKVCKEENVELINLSKYPTLEFEFGKFGLKTLVISRIVHDVDFIINLPKLKTHSLTVFTCGVKNMYGLVPGMTKSIYHRYAPHPKDFLEIIYAVYNYKPPDLTIVDGIMGMDGEGPSSGDVKKFDLILTSTNAVSIDWYVSTKILKLSHPVFYKKSWLVPAKIESVSY
ncbi:MAG: DUF362 domain-containing protein, partial [Endomicrobia bacterium]|nr:DUF362 domain-containing protein [Endomicrobiia bacterium]